VFESYTDEPGEQLSCAGCMEAAKKLLKILFILVSFLLILTSTVVSKLTILFITSKLVKYRDYVDQSKITSFITVTNTSCRQFDYDMNMTGVGQCGVPLCVPVAGLEGPILGIRWVWALAMGIGTPYMVVIFRCIRQMLFKKKDNPKLGPTVFVSVSSCSIHRVKSTQYYYSLFGEFWRHRLFIINRCN